MKRILSVFAILLALTFAFGSCAPKQQFITIATGGTAGTYFPLGGAMAEIWQAEIPGMNASAQATGASVANVNLLKENNVDVIFVQNDIAYYAVNGLEMFAGNAFPDMRGFATLYQETCQLIALASSGINSVADLRGKRVAVGAAGSGVEANARQIMEAAGISYADITVQYLSFAEAAANLKDGNVDAAFLTAGYPTSAVQDIAASKAIVLVPLSQTIISALIAKYPFYTQQVVPANTYNGVGADVQTVAVKAMLAISSRLENSVVEKMASTLFASGERLTAAHRQGANITIPNAQDGMSLPLHPGAERYYAAKR
ncbi:MAG: C4-dicarboxylate ABC transporter substrate-binding protein [Spirochaetes bacterium GWD1_61_31]|nr:MAG: C4-dicarboxylate ABC transporter substrate-binding protein [Spirochaetes bacterium GWB1_60_80]OHD39980.1 MAG: C4-dicarboxylate ABC transporter substrate-binding protein [Spirochaetes bacterium GWD1_61_31]OHD42366.1 MAG: C4-dicarboxylate ABC transporter substrate-binding protein [Spirochaetes bacterium GWE1_60_18]OHD60538.1 MAG: C4-dicarboxylate ABC transporter substrate-binding protein [Spirochaetes bacterium GWF1_60_12]HBO41440.1 C4-dicarboxylate ABC transporter substrate-binding prote